MNNIEYKFVGHDPDTNTDYYQVVYKPEPSINFIELVIDSDSFNVEEETNV